MDNNKIYYEDGGRWLVEVISDDTQNEMRTVKLKCLRTIRSPRRINITVDHIWEVSARDGFESYVGWHLMENKIELLDIPKDSKIICDCSDGSSYIIFRHIDGMYSFCVTENGNITHLYCMSELSLLPDGSYKLENDSLLSSHT